MKRLLALAAVAALSLSACGGSDGPKASDPTTQSGDTGTTAPASQPGTATTSAAKSDSYTKPFGQTFTWEGKSEVTCQAPVVAEPSQTAEMMKGEPTFDEFVTIDCVTKNLSDEPKNPFEFGFKGKSGSKESDQIFDTGAGIGQPMSSDLLPGEESSFTLGFFRKAGEPFTLQVDGVMFDKSGYYRA